MERPENRLLHQRTSSSHFIEDWTNQEVHVIDALELLSGVAFAGEDLTGLHNIKKWKIFCTLMT